MSEWFKVPALKVGVCIIPWVRIPLYLKMIKFIIKIIYDITIWLFSTNYKDIGTLYINMIFSAFSKTLGTVKESISIFFVSLNSKASALENTFKVYVDLFLDFLEKKIYYVLNLVLNSYFISTILKLPIIVKFLKSIKHPVVYWILGTLFFYWKV